MKKVIYISRFGGPEVLKLKEENNPEPSEGELQISVHAAGINFADLVMRVGLYPEAPKPPFVPGYEFAGVVKSIGRSVKDFKIGDRVLGACRFGGYTSELNTQALNVRKIPERISFEEAAAIPVNFMTAWVALVDMARIRNGDRVFIPSAAGGVGLAVLQICKSFGAEAVGTASSEKKFTLMKEFGATHCVLEREFEENPKKWGEFSVILDTVGGQSLKNALKRVNAGGRIVSYGVSSMMSGKKRSLAKLFSMLVNTPLILPFKLMNENKGIFGLNALSLMATESGNQLLNSALDHSLKRFETGEFRVQLGKVFDLKDASRAHEALHNRGNSGKMVLKCQ